MLRSSFRILLSAKIFENSNETANNSNEALPSTLRNAHTTTFFERTKLGFHRYREFSFAENKYFFTTAFSRNQNTSHPFFPFRFENLSQSTESTQLPTSTFNCDCFIEESDYSSHIQVLMFLCFFINRDILLLFLKRSDHAPLEVPYYIYIDIEIELTKRAFVNIQ